jgi:hypothetical protein
MFARKNIVFLELKKRLPADKTHDGCTGKKLYLPLILIN